MFAVVFLALQACLSSLVFSSRFRTIIHQKKLLQVGIFVCVQLLCLFLLLSSRFNGVRESVLSALRPMLTLPSVTPPESFQVIGDPGLVRWIEKQGSSLPRPDFADSDTFRTWQKALRSTLVSNVFQLHDRALPEPIRVRKVSSVIVRDNITRIFLTYESFDGTNIPAYLFVPPTPGHKPAIIVLHGHPWHENGEGISETAGLVDSYQHSNALELARSGYVTLTIEFRGFGYLGSRAQSEHRLVAHNAILGGSFYKAVLCKDIRYAFEFLRSFEGVNPQRVGITGASLGGELAVTYAALDERIKVVVFQSFGGQVGPEQGIVGQASDQPHYDHIIPNHNVYLYREDMFFLIAPRPLLGVWGDKENAVQPGFRELIGKAYECLMAPLLVNFVINPGGHEYFNQPAIEFFKQHL